MKKIYPLEYHAIVLAGGKDALAEHYRVASKALIPFASGTLVSPLLRHLRKMPYVHSITYIGEAPQEGKGSLVDWQVEADSSFHTNLTAALQLSQQHIKGDPFLLLCSSDIPYITLTGLETLLAAMDVLRQDSSLELIYPIIKTEACHAAFPEQRRTSIHVAEGSVTGGNIFAVRRSTLLYLLPWLDKAYRYRKNPLRLAQLLGWRVLISLLLRRASLTWFEQHIGQRLGVRAATLLSDDAALATDIDTLEHLEALRVFASNQQES